MASPFFFYLLTPLIFLHSLIFPNNLPSRVVDTDDQLPQLATQFGGSAIGPGEQQRLEPAR